MPRWPEPAAGRLPVQLTRPVRLAGAPLAASQRLRNLGQGTIGMALGLYFTPQLDRVAAAHSLRLLLVGVLVPVAFQLTAPLYRWVAVRHPVPGGTPGPSL